MDIDPDLQFFTRLALGRGAQRVITIFALTVGIAALAVGAHLSGSLAGGPPWRSPGDRPLLFVAFALAIFAGLLPTARLLELEAVGFLDHLRMCGRPSMRVLLALIGGSAWPYLCWVLPLLTIDAVWFHGAAGAFAVATFAFVASLSVGLLITVLRVQSPPPVRQAEAFGLKPFSVYLSGVFASLLFGLGWASGDVFTRYEIAWFAGAGALLPVLLWLEARLFDRPVAVRPRRYLRLGAEKLARSLPRAGPPEFMRQLRSAIGLSGGLGVALWPQLGLLAIVVVSRRFNLPDEARSATLMAISILIAAASGVMVMTTVRQETQTGTLDLLRLTPQKPESIALGWYAGIATPVWIAALLAAVAAAAISPALWERPIFWQALLGAALVSPAIGLADGFAPRMPETFIVIAILIVLMTVSESIFVVHIPLTGDLPFGLHKGLVTTMGVALVALGVALGRLRRPEGPPLSGGAALAAIVVVVIALRGFRSYAFPRMAVAMMAVIAPLFAEDRPSPTAPWTRVAIGAASAALIVGLMAGHIGIGSFGAAWTALGAAIAFGVGVLGYEAVPKKALALFLPLTIMIAVQRPSFATATEPLRTLMNAPTTPAALQASDVAVLAAAAVAAAVAHVAVRRRFAETLRVPQAGAR